MQYKHLDNIVQGLDSSFSIYNEKYQQSYHSKSLGAYTETMLKHIFPALFFQYQGSLANPPTRKKFLDIVASLQKNSQNLSDNNKQNIQSIMQNLQNINTNQIFKHRPIRILDICFGLGYNAMLGLEYFQPCEIYSPEQDNILQNLIDFPYHNLPQSKIILQSLIQACLYTTKKNWLYFLHGNALDYLETFSNGFFDIVFQDAFSQNQNPELWSTKYFQRLYNITAHSCIITTYAKAKVVLENAKNAGFETLKYNWGSIFYKKDSCM